ncbi:MAG: helix-turn-helix domain-containing protein [Clostridia bacterium]|nr:helix-turn-helix domain-containing protein [Clostridia bacterium]
MENKELEYKTVCMAIHGDHEAQTELLKYYDSYINKLATVEETDENGNLRFRVDEDIKAEIQLKYLEAIPKCKVIE